MGPERGRSGDAEVSFGWRRVLRGVRGGCAVTHAVAGSRGRSTCVGYSEARRVESVGCGGQPGLEAPDPGIGLLCPGGQRFDTSPGAAVSRGSVARQCARCGAAVDADGGGRPNTSGTMGTGARNIVANSAGRSTLR